MKFSVIIPRFEGHIHSHALDEVAETVHYGLRAIGHDSELQSFAEDRRHIIIGAHLLGEEILKAAPGTIIYNLEQTDAPWVPQYGPLFKHFTLWDYSERNVSFWKSSRIPAVHVPIGYVPELTRIVSAPIQDIDVLFYGCINERRHNIILDLLDRNFGNVLCTDAVYGNERDALIGRSKVVLNMHFYEPGIFEIARVSYLLANRKCVVSEDSIDIPYGLFNGVYFVEYKNLAMYCQGLVEDDEQREAQSDNGFELFKKFDERDILMKALAES